MYARVRKPYSGSEGRRVHPDTVFYVQKTSAKPPAGLICISQHRFKDLERLKLVEAVDEAKAKALIKKAQKAGKSEPSSRPPRTPAPAPALDPKAKVDPSPRTKERRELRKRHPVPNGGPTGATEQPSSLAAALPSVAGSLKLRGVRPRGNRSNGSASTEPPNSSPKATPTDVTLDGGGNTADSSPPIEDAV